MTYKQFVEAHNAFLQAFPHTADLPVVGPSLHPLNTAALLEVNGKVVVFLGEDDFYRKEKE